MECKVCFGNTRPHVNFVRISAELVRIEAYERCTICGQLGRLTISVRGNQVMARAA